MEASRETTVLFAAIIGGADLHAKADAGQAHDALDQCQFRLGRAAASCGGRLAKATADKVMVLSASADAAADAASAMHMAMDRMPRTAGVKLAAGIGMHFGPVIQKDDDVYGEPVNLAAKLCEQAGPGQIILSEWTATLLSPLYRQWLRQLDVGLCELVWRADDDATAFVRARAGDKPAPAILRLKFHGKRIELRREREVILIGRGGDCGLQLRDDHASRHHCTIERRNDKFVVADTSTNGTYVTIDGETEIALGRGELTLSKRGWIAIGNPRGEAKEVVEFFLGPAPVR